MKRKPPTVVSLYCEASADLLKRSEHLPSSAPIIGQILENLAELRRRALVAYTTPPGPESIAAFVVCARGLLTSDAQPFRRLVRNGTLKLSDLDRMLSG